MTTDLGSGPDVQPTLQRPLLDVAPPGERYYRHPGDVLRLVAWGLAALLLAVLIDAAPATTEGVTADLGSVAQRVATGIRELSLALLQVGAVLVPIGVAAVLVVQRRWRRLVLVLLAAAAGALVLAGIDIVLDLPGRAPGAISSGTWIASTRFPPLAYLAGATSAATLGKPWLNRSWRRATDWALFVLAFVMALAGIAGVPGLLLAVTVGAAAGSAILVLVGAPNRRPSPAQVAETLEQSGFPVARLDLRRAEGGRTQLYSARSTDGRRAFVKVFGRDTRDADVLYRTYRTALLRGTTDLWPAGAKLDVEHEAFLLLLARRGGVSCPDLVALAPLPDGSVLLALDEVDGDPLDRLPVDDVSDQLLETVWREVRDLHEARLAHRSLRAGNVLVAAGRPVVIDFGFGQESAGPRLQAIDRAELLASLAPVVGAQRAVASAARVVDSADLAAAQPFLQPLALSAATRRGTSKATLAALRDGISQATGVEAAPLERLMRVRPRTLLMIAVLTGAFYVLLPQLANVSQSVEAARDADWAWMLVCLALSLATYLFAAIGLAGGIPQQIPFVPNVHAQFASSFVNRVTPANVGGMALNVRFMQKAGVDAPVAVTGVGLNTAAGGVVHLVLLVLFLAWAGQSGSQAFAIPSSSKLLVVLAVLLALAGLIAATARGRSLFRRHVLGFLRRSLSSLPVLARSPGKLAALLGGSAGVTLAYIAALAAAVAAFHGDVTLAQVGAVYLGASVLAAAAPTPGGLGAMEAALVAGLTGVGMASGPAVAAVLSYRLATYWLPILPGWISFQLLERRGLI